MVQGCGTGRAGGPSSGQKVPFMRPGERKQEDRAGTSARLCPKHLGLCPGPGAGVWGGQGQRLRGGWG